MLNIDLVIDIFTTIDNEHIKIMMLFSKCNAKCVTGNSMKSQTNVTNLVLKSSILDY